MTRQERASARRGRLLVTGGAGFIGHHAVREARRRGWDVTVLDNLSVGRADRLPPDVPLLPLDLRTPDLEAALRGERFAGVIHLAAQTSVRYSMEHPEEDRAVNLDGTARLLNAIAREHRACRFVFCSTAAVYGPQAGPLREDGPEAPLSYYGKHKADAEKCVRAAGLPHAIMRLANVYGAGQRIDADGGVIAIFLDRLRAGAPLAIEGDGEQTRDFIYVGDVARALVDACEPTWPAAGTWNVSTGQETSLNAVIGAITELAERRVGVLHVAPRPGDIRRSCLSNDRIAAATGWRPAVSLREGLAATFAAAPAPALARDLGARTETEEAHARTARHRGRARLQ